MSIYISHRNKKLLRPSIINFKTIMEILNLNCWGTIGLLLHPSDITLHKVIHVHSNFLFSSCGLMGGGGTVRRILQRVQALGIPLKVTEDEMSCALGSPGNTAISKPHIMSHSWAAGVL